MYPKPTFKEQVDATLKVLGLRPVCPDEDATYLNECRVPARGATPGRPQPWRLTWRNTPSGRREVLPDLSHFAFVVPDRKWN